MKLSFSTRGWLDMHWEEMLDAAKEMGFAGIEIYSVFRTPELYGKGGPLHKYNVAATARELREKQLQIFCNKVSIEKVKYIFYSFSVLLSFWNTKTVKGIRRTFFKIHDFQVRPIVDFRYRLPGLPQADSCFSLNKGIHRA